MCTDVSAHLPLTRVMKCELIMPCHILRPWHQGRNGSTSVSSLLFRVIRDGQQTCTSGTRRSSIASVSPILLVRPGQLSTSTNERGSHVVSEPFLPDEGACGLGWSDLSHLPLPPR